MPIDATTRENQLHMPAHVEEAVRAIALIHAKHRENMSNSQRVKSLATAPPPADQASHRLLAQIQFLAGIEVGRERLFF